jgi:hypothetical protein
MRRSLLLTLVLLAGALPVGVASLGSVANAAPTIELGPCTSEADTDCIVSVHRNGDPISLPTGPSDDYEVFAAYFVNDITGLREYTFSVSRPSGSPGGIHSLDPSDTWKVVLDFGSYYPDETFSRGRSVNVVRSGNATDGFQAAFTMKPVRMATGACNSSGECGGPSSEANKLYTGYLEGWINDAAYVTDPDERASRRGFDMASNADWVSTPPQLEWETRSLIVDVGNAHFEPDGTTPFLGSAEMRLPFSMLKHLYYVDDPATLTASAFRVGASGTSAPDISVVVGDTDVDVKITNIPFSKRTIAIKGNVKPLAPKDIEAVRKSGRRAVVKFGKAKARGSKVTGYRVVCKRPGDTVKRSAAASPIGVKGLKKGEGYDCRVAAKSKAGLGRTRLDHLEARP